MRFQEPRLHYFDCPAQAGGAVAAHRMAYWAWGAPQAEHVVVAVHGLARQGRDFDTLASALVDAYPQLQVLCPDIVGRGLSDWLQTPMAYQPPTYGADVLAWLTQLAQERPIRRLDWIGTSMGGLIGMLYAATVPAQSAVALHRLVLNDVGPRVEWRFIERLRGYLGQLPRYADPQQAAAALWEVSTGFGSFTPAQWQALCEPMLRRLPGGEWTLHYDPAIAAPVRALTPEQAAQGEAVLWSLYDRITVPTLLLRGEVSDVLSVQTAQEMTQRGPRASLHTFAQVGHAPMFNTPDQVQVVLKFLGDGLS